MLSSPRGGRLQRSVAGFPESKRRSLFDPHQAEWTLYHPLLRGPDLHRISSRGTSLGTDSRRNRQAGIARRMVAQAPLSGPAALQTGKAEGGRQCGWRIHCLVCMSLRAFGPRNFMKNSVGTRGGMGELTPLFSKQASSAPNVFRPCAPLLASGAQHPTGRRHGRTMSPPPSDHKEKGAGALYQTVRGAVSTP